MASPLPATVICGPQTIPPPPQCLEQLRARLAHDPELKPLLEAILNSPSLLSQLQAIDGNLQHLAPSTLADFRNWALDRDHDNDHSHAFASQLSESLPNILLAPLTVLIHIVQYMAYLDTLDLAADDEDDGDDLDAHARIREIIISQPGGFQGLCTGTLSATVLACSSTRAQIGLHAVTALNLAVCIGAYTDVGQHHENEGFGCAVARWRVSFQRGELEEVLSRYPQAYISVELDEFSATITAPQADLPPLGAELAAKSIPLSNLPLRGRYHSQDNQGALETVLRFCDSEPGLRFPAPVFASAPIERGQSESAATPQHHELCLRSILTERANWHLAVSETVSALPSSNSNSTGTSASPSVILELGLVDCIPPQLAASPELRIIRAASLRDIHTSQSQSQPSNTYPYPDHCITIIGAACKYPGAESLDELWKLISTAQSMQGPVPRERHTHCTPRPGRHSHPGGGETPGQQLTGNFISGAENFDATFFGISPREATYMDPQQRVALQVAYRALESAGYFASQHPQHQHGSSDRNSDNNNNVGVYLGAGGSDYSALVDSQPPSAFSFTGTSRAFISGRIAHFFNFRGPALTIDTACSSSSVAIHAACSAILSGECGMALAGGVSLICHPATHENLATANFLNSSGTPCRAFDADANGYARGEGCGFLLLKRLSDALADGDPVLAVIAGSATNSCGGGIGRSITVPVSDPQVALYREALRLASMEAARISYVEAHGTGTTRGDPVEWHSLHEVFGHDRDRDTDGKVYVGSIKSNIGHTEAASGVAGVLKVLSMLRHARMPPQANFSAFSPVIPRGELRALAIPGQLLNWEVGFRAACVNNYGAAGNNTVLVVCQRPCSSGASADVAEKSRRRRHALTALRYPIRICAHSTASLAKNCDALARCLARTPTRPTLPDVAFALAQRQNPSLSRHLIFEAASLDELEQALTSPTHVDANTRLVSQTKAKPVVLIFAGQTGTTIHLSRPAYEMSALLRKHLDACDAVLRDDLRLPSLFPGIFSQELVADIVMLHCAGFAVQYAVAMAWLDSGLRVQQVIGHSFGQLTAMCVAGVITLKDALRLVSGRAQLIQAEWGNEKGAMLSVKADRETVLSLTHSSTNCELEVEVACFNGPTSHVLVGSEATIEALITAEEPKMKMRLLNMSHGFHSRYIDAFLDRYLQLAREISYSTPKIPIETCSESASWEAFTPELVAEHSRKPVYFVDAVQRIRERYGPCIWLEAGSRWKGVSLVKEALARDNNLSDSFHALQLGAGAGAGAGPMQSLVDTTLRLWKEGVSVGFWGYHTIERPLLEAAVDLPGYQFDESSYWLQPARAKRVQEKERSLLGLVKLSSPAPQVTRLEIDQLAPGIAEILRGREVLGGSLWPISLYLELVSQAAALLTPGLPWEFQRVRLQDFEIQVSLGSRHIPYLGLCLQQLGACAWGWSVRAAGQESVPHATGKITLEDQRASCPPAGIDDDKVPACRRGSEPITLLSATGSIAYRLLGNVASYDACYQGIDSVTMSEHEATAQLSTPQAAREWEGRESLNPILLDQFMLVAELHALATCKRKRGELFTCSGVQEVVAYKGTPAPASSSWTVLTRQSSVQGRVIYYDTYVYDSIATDLVAFVIRGAKFVKVASHVLQRVVDRANAVLYDIKPPIVEAGPVPEWGTILPIPIQPQVNAWSTTAQLVHQLTGFPAGQITPGTALTEIGMDSLATAELEHRVKELFGADITVDVSEKTATFGSLMETIQQQGSPRQTADTASSLFSPSTGSSSLSTAVEPINLASDAMSKLCGTIAEYLGNADMVLPDMPLQSLGLDSLVAIELESALLDSFGVHVSLMQMYETVTPNALYKLLVPSESESQSGSHSIDHAADQFAHTQKQIGAYCQEAGFAGFFERVFPKQTALVLAYLIEAFAVLGCDLSLLPPEAPLPEVQILPKHTRVMAYYYSHLAEAGLIAPMPTPSPTKDTTSTSFIRTSQPLPDTPSSTLYHEILQSFPHHRPEHKLLHRTGANLAACLSGKADPLRLLFSDRGSDMHIETQTETASSLLADVYTNSPMFKMGTLALGDFLTRLLSSTPSAPASPSLSTPPTPIRILELGAGTGGTTAYLLSQLKPLTQQQAPIIYTFTDISPTLVSRARKSFASYDFITYKILDVEKIPVDAVGQYDLIISSNCIHATKDLHASCRGLYDLLRPRGMLCLLELTRDVPWLNLVFGLLDGWWAFGDADGRSHVLADERLWERVLRGAGFGGVQWSGDDGSAEGEVYRLIVGVKR